jgi:hypothetical protein
MMLSKEAMLYGLERSRPKEGVLNQGSFFPLGDVWQRVERFDCPGWEGGVLRASSEKD